MSNKPPAFQFYAADWLSSPEIMLMTPAEEGAYIRLLAIAWDKGGLPDDDDQLAVLSRLGEGWFNGGSTKLRAQFVKRGNKLINKKQEIIRKTQKEWSKKSRQGGLASAKARQQKALRDKNASTTLATKGQPKGNTNTNTSTSLALETNNSQGRGLDLETQKAALVYTEKLERMLGPFSPAEKKTFRGVLDHLISYAADRGNEIFEMAIEWAVDKREYIDRHEGKNKQDAKRMFMAEVKKRTGFRAKAAT